MLSSLITITMTPYYGALKNSIRSQSWKLLGGGLSSFGTFISAWIDNEKMLDAYESQQFAVSAIYFVKSAGGATSGVAVLIDATSTAAPLLKKLAKRYGTVVVIEAVEIATKRVIALAAMRIVGMLAGWEATITLLALQGMTDCLTPNDLENWCTRCAFGNAQATTGSVTDQSNARYTDPSQQERDYVNAMTKLS